MQNIIQNRDFYFTAFLIASGAKLQGIKRENGLTIFYFDNNEITKNLSNEFYSFNGVIEPITYSNSIKALKSIIHSSNTNSTNNIWKTM